MSDDMDTKLYEALEQGALAAVEALHSMVTESSSSSVRIEAAKVLLAAKHYGAVTATSTPLPGRS